MNTFLDTSLTFKVIVEEESSSTVGDCKVSAVSAARLEALRLCVREFFRRVPGLGGEEIDISGTVNPACAIFEQTPTTGQRNYHALVAMEWKAGAGGR